MIDAPKLTFEVTMVTLQDYLDWIIQFLKLTGMTLASVLLIILIVYLFVNVFLSMLTEIIPIIKGLMIILEYIFLPGSLMHNVWHVYALKRLNIPVKQQASFGWGWSRTAIRVSRPTKNFRESLIYFWAPLMNIPVIIVWIIPGMLLFEWLDSLVNSSVFYWLWLYILVSLIIRGLPDVQDLINPLQITVNKTPEFYLFVMYYIIIAPITLILWGWGLTIIFSLFYAILLYYEVGKIASKEERRLSTKFDNIKESLVTKEKVFYPDSDLFDS
ncbi:MAG: hypothetical protein U9O98_10440 [Asgard group archaeon]|nr:hypothetical protein [Asgard group archaeon]